MSRLEHDVMTYASQGEEIASEVFAEAIEVRKILNTASAQRYRARRKSPLITRQRLPFAAILADGRRHRLIAAEYGVSRSMISHIKGGRRPRRSSGTRGGRAANPLQEATDSVISTRGIDPATVTLWPHGPRRGFRMSGAPVPNR